MLNYFPKYFTSKAISLYVGLLVLCNVIFFSHTLAPIWWAFGLVEVLSFFYFSNQLTRKWVSYSEKKFVRKLFQTALIIRLVYVVFSYFFYDTMTGKPFEFDTGDAFAYHGQALDIMNMIPKGSIQPFLNDMKGRSSDMGYPFYLGLQYCITGGSIIIARLIKAFISAYTCVLIYKLATRNFGEGVGRMAAIFCILMPNIIFYTGLHLKETEMLFLTVAFMERADAMFRNKKFNLIEIGPPVLLAGLLFFFRTVLGAAAFLAMITTLFFSTTKVIGLGKRTVIIVWILAVVGYFIGGTVSTEVESVWSTRDKNQETSMKMRAAEKNGNTYAKYATGAIFAPIIFVIPFPTIVETPKQENQKIINGGNFVKNIMAFFVIFSLFWIIRNQKWRDYLLIYSFTIGYLIVISFSAFGQSERFHLPALPFELIMAAFGISLVTNKTKKYFTWWMMFIAVAVVAWCYIKLAGRGMA